MSIDFVRRLLITGVVQKDEVQRALMVHVVQEVPLCKALIDLGIVTPHTLEREMARADMPTLPTVGTLTPALALVQALPEGLCIALLALPLRLDEVTGVVDIAVVDAFDKHIAAEISYHLNAPVRVFRTPLTVFEDALRRLYPGRAFALREHEAANRSPLQRTASWRSPTYVGVPESEQDRPSMPRLRQKSGPPIPLVRRPTAYPPGPLQASAAEEWLDTSDLLEDESREAGIPLQQPRVPVFSLPVAGVRKELSASRAPAGVDVGSVAAALRRVTSRDEAIEQLLLGMRSVARRIGIFAVRRGEFGGWQCNEELGDPSAFRLVAIPTDTPSIFATAAATGYYLGPIPSTPSHTALLQVMGGYTDEVAVMPIRVGGKLALILLLDEFGDTMIATRRAEDLGRLVGEALSRLMQREKR